MRFFRNPNITVAALAAYMTIMFIIFIPKNNEMSDTEKIVTVLISIGVLALLWVLLRKREKLRREREREMAQYKEERRNKAAEEKGK